MDSKPKKQEGVSVQETEIVSKSDSNTAQKDVMKSNAVLNTVMMDKVWAQEVIDSGLVPETLTDPEQILIIIEQGKELGLSPFVALNNLHVIKGRPVLSATMLGALLKRRNIEWIIVEDYVPVKNSKDEVVNHRTTYEFYWKSKVTNNPMKARHSVTWNQLDLAGYTDKQNYERFPKEMMRARCISSGVRAYFPEVLLGMYTDVEMADVYNDSYDIDFKDGEPTLKIKSNK